MTGQQRGTVELAEIRAAIYGLLFLLVLAIVGVYFVTVVTVVIGEYVGGGGTVPVPDGPGAPPG